MSRAALICVRGFGIPRVLDRATELLPDGREWTIVHVIDQRPEGEVGRAIGHLPGRRGGLDRIHRSVELLQHDIQMEVEDWLAQTGRAAELALLYGVPEYEIVALAEELDAEIVVVGSRPEVGPHRFGHVNRFVIDHAPCSVLVIAPSEL